MDNIPKILHLYWGGEKMSWLQLQTITTFHKLNPDWEIFLYYSFSSTVEKNTKFINQYYGKDFFQEVFSEKFDYVKKIEVDFRKYSIDKNLCNIHKSDILRYILLYDIGGVWSDFDVLWLKPISFLKEKFIGDVFDSTVCIFECKTFAHYNIGILMSSQKSRFYQDIIQKTKEIPDTEDHQSFGVKMLNSFYPNYNELYHISKGIIRIPYNIFYPYSIHTDMDRLYKKNDIFNIKEDTICLHWFNGHELSKEYVNNDGYSRDCSMTNILKNIKLL